MSDLLPEALRRRIAQSSGPIVALTGAGISAESGVPTFRGPEGYWRVGSRNYHPTEMATATAFASMPDDVWRWYLHRRGVCRAAAPNAAHAALADLDQALGDRVRLVTQNVDGLHLRAGGDPARIFQIHGNLDFCRCVRGCAPVVRPLPEDATPAGLRCACGERLRPHVLWFDESYDEPLYRYVSALRAAQTAAALIVVGTSGATTLPARMCEIVAARGAPLIVIDVEPTGFAALAESTPAGLFLRATAVATLPPLARELGALRFEMDSSHTDKN
ncbi:MAG TPA: Sir2 family NAD-dependent protein deacetylase [Polyangia bacterium]|nr:Sir2 family NAD-dependent protein deacetylase [Polyangia bacterium]